MINLVLMLYYLINNVLDRGFIGSFCWLHQFAWESDVLLFLKFWWWTVLKLVGIWHLQECVFFIFKWDKTRSHLIVVRSEISPWLRQSTLGMQYVPWSTCWCCLFLGIPRCMKWPAMFYLNPVVYAKFTVSGHVLGQPCTVNLHVSTGPWCLYCSEMASMLDQGYWKAKLAKLIAPVGSVPSVHIVCQNPQNCSTGI